MQRVHPEVSVPRYLPHSLPLFPLPVPCKWEFDFALHWNPFLRDEWRFSAKPRWPCWFLTEINGDGGKMCWLVHKTVTRRLSTPPGSLCLIVAVTLSGSLPCPCRVIWGRWGEGGHASSPKIWTGKSAPRVPRGTSCWGLQCCWKIIYLCYTF